MALTKTPIELSSTPGIVDNSNATAITIDASENVLVGKTATAFGTAGIALRGTVADFIRDGGTPINVNRLTDDGRLIDMHKNSVLVGSIGTYSGDLTIGNGSTVGLIFEQTGSDRISPWNLTTNATRDGEIDLGDSDQRWKDIYLSGGAYLGGTAAANKLDDFEEGTWSLTSNATISNTTVAQYVRVGRLVTGVVDVQLASSQTSTSALEFNLPITSDGNFGAGVVNYTNGSLAAQPLTANPDTQSKLHIRYSHGNNGTIAQFNGARIILNFTYFTNA